MQLVLRVLSVLPATAINAAVALDHHSQFGLSCRPWKIDPDAHVVDPNRIEEDVSFVLKDTPVDPDRECLGLVILTCVFIKKLLSFL